MNDNANTAPGAGQPSDIFLKAVRYVLRPLVKTLITHGVTFPMIAEMLKRVFVETVDTNFRLAADKKPTDSRVSLITGVHRKNIKQFREQAEQNNHPHMANSLSAQIIAKWCGVSQYMNRQGEPAPLARFAADSKTASFESLVSSISTDIRPRAVLDDLLKRKVLSLGSDDTVTLEQSAFIPREDMAELLVHYSRNIHDHLAAAGSNIQGDGAPYLERSVYHYNLNENAVRLLEDMAEKEGMKVLLALNHKAQQLMAVQEAPSEETKRITFGVYFYAEQDGGPKT